MAEIRSERIRYLKEIMDIMYLSADRSIDAFIIFMKIYKSRHPEEFDRIKEYVRKKVTRKKVNADLRFKRDPTDPKNQSQFRWATTK